jgi:hypothetical protein
MTLRLKKNWDNQRTWQGISSFDEHMLRHLSPEEVDDWDLENIVAPLALAHGWRVETDNKNWELPPAPPA